MILFFTADSFGRLSDLYKKIEEQVQWKGTAPDWVIHVGSFGVWPDPKRVNRATRLKDIETDFHKYYLTSTPVPYRTLFLPGKHEDHRWLRAMYNRQYLEILPNLHHLISSNVKVLANETETYKILGIGKVYSPKTYNGNSNPKKSIYHYTKQDIEKACSSGPVDIVISTEAGHGARFGNIISQAEGINNVYWALRPTIAIHGHYNYSACYRNEKTDTQVWALAHNEVLTLDLNKKYPKGYKLI